MNKREQKRAKVYEKAHYRTALNANSLDVVNGSQLFSTNQTINNIATGGAGSKYFHANSTPGDSTPTGTKSVAIGPLSTAGMNNAVSIGNGATASAVANNKNDVALGASSTTGTANPVSTIMVAGVSQAVAGTNPTSVVSVGSVGNERQITNVAAGRVSSTSTDAVNGSELYYVQQEVNTLASSGGGGGGSGPVQYSNAATPTTPNGGTKTQEVTLVGATTGTPVTLHNVANGSTAAGSTDAINGGQLNKLSGGIAAASALGGAVLPDPGTSYVGVSTAEYNGQGGLGLSVVHHMDASGLVLSAGVALGTGGTSPIVRAAAGWVF